MNKTNRTILLVLIAGITACHQANGQTQTQSPPANIRSHTGKDAGWTGYSTGGERGGVVQVISDAEVQAELKLNNEQQKLVGDILRHVKAMEDELFEDFRRSHLNQSDRLRALREERAKQYREANQQLARATEKILALLTPAQRT